MNCGYLPCKLVLACLLASVMCIQGSYQQHRSSEDPPRIVGSYQARQIAKVGQVKKKFTCPVAADQQPIVQWYKDDEAITELWLRFRTTKEGALRIRDIELEDAGKYICRATNGYGSISVNYSLIVVATSSGVAEDKENGLVKEADDNYDQGPEEETGKDGASPHFLEEQKMKRNSVIEQPVNSSVRLKCRADGNPRPHIRWMKDQQILFDERTENKNKRLWTLILRDLQEHDSGSYECVVSNKHGVINFTYSLDVVGKLKTKPVLIAPWPLNQTVSTGGTASFLCKVKSEVEPHIQWFKRVDKQSDIEHFNNSIEIKGQKFIVLKTGEVWEDDDGIFLNKIAIKKVLPVDVGMYICLGSNWVGYSFRSAFLTMSDRPGIEADIPQQDVFHSNLDGGGSVPQNNANGEGSNTATTSKAEESIGNGSLPLMIAIPACVAIVLVTLAIFILQRRRCNSQSNVQRNTRFNAVPTQEQRGGVGGGGENNFNPVVAQQHHTNLHILPQNALSNSRSGDKMAKNGHNFDFHSDISSVSRCHHQQQQQPQQQQQQMPQQHTNVQYGY